MPSPVVIDDTVYIGSNDSNVYALDAAGGPNWTYATDYPVVSPAVVDDTVYTGVSAPTFTRWILVMAPNTGPTPTIMSRIRRRQWSKARSTPGVTTATSTR